MPKLPEDPNRLASYYMTQGALITLNTLYDVFSDILVFNLDNVYEVGTSEYQSAADCIEGLRQVVAFHHNRLAANLSTLLDDDTE